MQPEAAAEQIGGIILAPLLERDESEAGQRNADAAEVLVRVEPGERILEEHLRFVEFASIERDVRSQRCDSVEPPRIARPGGKLLALVQARGRLVEIPLEEREAAQSGNRPGAHTNVVVGEYQCFLNQLPLSAEVASGLGDMGRRGERACSNSWQNVRSAVERTIQNQPALVEVTECPEDFHRSGELQLELTIPDRAKVRERRAKVPSLGLELAEEHIGPDECFEQRAVG